MTLMPLPNEVCAALAHLVTLFCQQPRSTPIRKFAAGIDKISLLLTLADTVRILGT
jgi:hypothetical protein